MSNEPLGNFPVSAVMQCQQVEHRGWKVPRWSLLGFIAGDRVGDAAARRSVIHQDSGGVQYLWSGFEVVLNRQSAESYWHNLKGKTPSLFLVCRQDPQEGIVPFSVTADYDEAAAHMEADDTVFSAPLPPEMYRWLEAYVLEHYHPEPPKRRKRRDWIEEADGGKRS